MTAIELEAVRQRAEYGIVLYAVWVALSPEERSRVEFLGQDKARRLLRRLARLQPPDGLAA